MRNGGLFTAVNPNLGATASTMVSSGSRSQKRTTGLESNTSPASHELRAEHDVVFTTRVGTSMRPRSLNRHSDGDRVLVLGTHRYGR